MENVKEIELLIDGLKKSYGEMKNELPTNAPYAWGELENRRRDIEKFEAFYNEREKIRLIETKYYQALERAQRKLKNRLRK